MQKPFSTMTFALALVLSACAGSPVPTERLASTQAAVRAAEEVGANKAPQAELELKLAKEGLAEARSLVSTGDNERASYVLLRAEADAELARALAKEGSARLDAEKTMSELMELKQRAQ